ncbi:putative Deoxynucleotidyltransferase terminal-interacting protein 2 [Hypsibius exemplaris]|uniref:Deoxynucleotidyltransferase terminal-interacting protein 2 n=1 Tax=Hypsibius exemplaris TaxID=2072580 RepID=A0A1W0X814_HYPEX|nr:putative Deoxynucleotidyltransferase terminal-interacting protein 2 [Hypsibius exemplaris]
MASGRVRELARKLCRTDGDAIMAKSAITPGFEQQHSLPPYYQNNDIQKKQRRKERMKTKGEKWFNMAAPELTDELKNDLKAIRMRDTLDPSRFYKAPDTKGIPKFFQIGTVVETAADFYSSRIPKRQRKKTIVEELLVDAEFKRYRKRKANELFKVKHQTARFYKKKRGQAVKDAKSAATGKKSHKAAVEA